ncbi:hypothetical protein GCM10010517_20680 [Streptosporangium fragile]|uniref:Uncharacterized protein n=1 Tax=Streptosporangium fragile TaxID=46186 RepID=A0ABN3VVT1_9ACTN
MGTTTPTDASALTDVFTPTADLPPVTAVATPADVAGPMGAIGSVGAHAPAGACALVDVVMLTGAFTRASFGSHT